MRQDIRTIPVILVMTEGKTERVYLDHLRERGANYSLRIQSADGGGPLKMVKKCHTMFRTMAMDRGNGDRAVCVMDVDQHTEEEFRAAKAYAENNHILLLVSNPCFEVFFLYHYKRDVRPMSSRDMKAELSKYINGYREAGDYWGILSEKRKEALMRIKGYIFQPEMVGGTDVGSEIYLLFDMLEELRG